MKKLTSAKRATARKPAAKRPAAKVARKATKSTTPKLKKGEVYLGVVCEDGKLKNAQHVILLPGDKEPANWSAAGEWAKGLGGTLPTRMELLLMFKTRKARFQERTYWSGETYAGDESYAWGQDFYDGRQDHWRKDNEFRAVAVRRLPIQ